MTGQRMPRLSPWNDRPGTDGLRQLGDDSVTTQAAHRQERLTTSRTWHLQCSQRLLFGMVLGARLIPLVSLAAVSYGVGLTAMSTRVFPFATAIA